MNRLGVFVAEIKFTVAQLDSLNFEQKIETIGNAVRHWAEIRPEKPVLLDEDGQAITYGRLAQQVDEIGRCLNDMSFGLGDRIAIVHPNNARLAMLMIGVADVATALPMNPALSEEEYVRLMTDMNVSAVIVAADIGNDARRAASRTSVPVIAVHWGRNDLCAIPRLEGNGCDRDFRRGHSNAEDLAFVLGTSGTTGRSKIVPISHRLLLRRAKTRQRYEHTTSDDRCFFLNPLFLHNGLTSVGVTLVSGADMIVFPRFNLDAFFRCIETLQPTWFNGSFTYISSIIGHIAKTDLPLPRGAFRFLRPTSGAVDPADSKRIEEIFGAPVIEMLFSTECGSIAANPFPPGQCKHGTVGKAAGCEIRIRGEEGTILSSGQEGEVLVRGENVFSGYESDTEANDEAFIDGWYRSGDRGFLDEDGYLTLTGRLKEMINRGGEKIAPVEIDLALKQLANVADAAAFAIPHRSLGEIVGAAIVLRPDAAPDKRQISAALKNVLSPIKRPNAYLFVDAIPRNLIGKIKRAELAKLYQRVHPS